ncbi:SDR family oxidoreductase [Aquimarina sp. LLG6339-5]|uniref:SDR family oxidoreductase n=1 Tax=Aquimarina sp. LLG6339-5 TaxID=3160830 RepID=UPI00386FECBB
MINNLENKVAVVTGGYGYLGEAMTISLSKAGARVYVAARNKDKFNEKFQDFENIYFLFLDISDDNSIKQAFKELYDKEKRIDILVNNAFFGSSNHPENITIEEWKKGIDGGLTSVFSCINEVFPYMKKNTAGKIINVSSMYGMVVPDLSIYEGREQFLNPPNYGVAKSGVLHLTKYYAMYLAKYNINVNAISPGPFPPPRVQDDKGFLERLKNKNPMKRIGKPEDLQGIVLLLASDASSYITGQNIAIDGGWTL